MEPRSKGEVQPITPPPPPPPKPKSLGWSACSLLGRIEQILDGIDRYEGDENEWWPTSTGQRFGEERLQLIRALFEENTQGQPRGEAPLVVPPYARLARPEPFRGDDRRFHARIFNNGYEVYSRDGHWAECLDQTYAETIADALEFFYAERMSAHTDNERSEAAVDVPRLIRDYFEDDGAPKKCPKCESINITEKVIGVVDVFQGIGPTCEAEYYCECGECVGFWAYGSWHPEYRESFIANQR